MDAVAEPLAIRLASSANSAAGRFVNCEPSPTKNDADTVPLLAVISVPILNPSVISKLPLTLTEPVNSDPLSDDSTKNPLSGVTEALTLPLAILNASSVSADCGILNNPLPSPVITPSTSNEFVTNTEPVNSCLLSKSLPNVFEPDDVITTESINVTLSSLAFIVPLTYKSLSIVKSPSIEPEVFTTNPKFGEIDAVTEPLAILGESSANADCGMLNNPAPSPLKIPSFI